MKRVGVDLQDADHVAKFSKLGYDGIAEDMGELHNTIPTQIGYKSKRREIFYPTAELNISSSITIKIKGAANEFIDINQTRLMGSLRLIKQNGTEFVAEDIRHAAIEGGAAAPPVGNRDYAFFVNGIGTAWAKECTVLINNQVISQEDNNYAYKADIENRFLTSNDIKKNELKSIGYYPEKTSYNPEHLANICMDHGANRNIPLKTRYDKVVGSQLLEFESKIHSPIFDQTKPLPPGTEITIIFKKNTDDFLLLGNDVHKIVHGSLSIVAQFLNTDQEILNEIIKTTLEDPFKYQLRNAVVQTFSKPQNLMDLSINDLFPATKILPRRIFVVLVNQYAYTGTRRRDPFLYSNMSINFAELRIGGQCIPDIQLKTRLNQLSCLTRACQASLGGRSNGINIDNYENRNFCLGWDLSPVEALPPLNAYMLPMEESAQLILHVREQNDHPITIIVYAEYESELLMDANGKIIKNEQAL